MNSRIWIAAALIAFAGCGKKDESAKPAAAQKEPADKAVADKGQAPSEQCKKDVAEFATWFQALLSAGSPIGAFGKDLLESELPPAWIPEVDSLEVGKSSIEAFDSTNGARDGGAPMNDATARTNLQKAKDTIGSEDDAAVLIQPSKDAPWSRIFRAVEMARQAGYTRVHFVLEAKGPEAPPESKEHAKIKEHLFDMQEELYKQCPAWGSYFFTRVPGDRTARQLSDEEGKAVPDALLACNCAVDFAVVKDYEYAIELANAKHHAAITVELASDDAADATSVSQSKAQPWSATFAAVIDAAKAGKPVRFAVSK